MTVSAGKERGGRPENPATQQSRVQERREDKRFPNSRGGAYRIYMHTGNNQSQQRSMPCDHESGVSATNRCFSRAGGEIGCEAVAYGLIGLAWLVGDDRVRGHETS